MSLVRRVVLLGAIAVGALLAPAASAKAQTGHGPVIVNARQDFECRAWDFTVLGGGTMTRHLKTVTVSNDGEYLVTHTTGWFRFRADNGERRTYPVDYLAKTVLNSEGEGIFTESYEGTFVVSDVIEWNNWYYGTGVATFAEGGYWTGGPATIRNICTELGYPFVVPPDE